MSTKNMKTISFLAVIVCFLFTIVGVSQEKSASYLNKRWKDVATRMPDEWYGSEEAIQVANNVLLAQKEIGGWEKNKSFHKPFSEKEVAHYTHDKSKIGATFDNGATITELRFLAKMYAQMKDERYKRAFEKGLNYIFAAQYENGGWPQFFPVRKGSEGYSAHITYNDNAMVNTMQFLKEVYADNKAYNSFHLKKETKAKAKQAFDKGIECMLNTQIRVDGKPTVWCAQHDEKTLKPAKARSYELASFSGAESVGIVLLLMDMDEPSKEIIASVIGAKQWFETHKIEGLKLERETMADGKKNRVVVNDSTASPLWGRFYDLETEKIFFCDRDGIKKNSLDEIGYNRRNGYSWYTNAPEKVLRRYPEWLAKHNF